MSMTTLELAHYQVAAIEYAYVLGMNPYEHTYDSDGQGFLSPTWHKIAEQLRDASRMFTILWKNNLIEIPK
jgi:hypothetical protein